MMYHSAQRDPVGGGESLGNGVTRARVVLGLQ
jgi:hypothetical protein